MKLLPLLSVVAAAGASLASASDGDQYVVLTPNQAAPDAARVQFLAEAVVRSVQAKSPDSVSVGPRTYYLRLGAQAKPYRLKNAPVSPYAWQYPPNVVVPRILQIRPKGSGPYYVTPIPFYRQPPNAWAEPWRPKPGVKYGYAQPWEPAKSSPSNWKLIAKP